MEGWNSNILVNGKKASSNIINTTHTYFIFRNLHCVWKRENNSSLLWARRTLFESKEMFGMEQNGTRDLATVIIQRKISHPILGLRLSTLQ